jgi:hypothetical protein
MGVAFSEMGGMAWSTGVCGEGIIMSVFLICIEHGVIRIPWGGGHGWDSCPATSTLLLYVKSMG